MTAPSIEELRQRAWTAISAVNLGTAWMDVLLDPSDNMTDDEKKEYLLGVVGFLFGMATFTTRTLLGICNEHRDPETEPLTYQELVALLQRNIEEGTT